MKEVGRQADLRGLARYIMTVKGMVRDRQRGQGQKVVFVSEHDKRSKSEAHSGPLKSGIIIFK